MGLLVRSILFFCCFSYAFAAEWRSIGPYIGSANDLAFDPRDPQVIYAATQGAGVWRSDDGGQNWSLPGNDLARRTVAWIEVDPADSDTLWAGVEQSGGPGLWRSTDRGASWGIVQTDPYSRPLDQRIAFAPSDPRFIYVPSTNLHFRSRDGGKTWSSFRVEDQDAYAFAVHPSDPNHLLAGGRGQTHQFRRSTDGGDTWQAAGGGLPERSLSLLTVDPANPDTLYVVAGFSNLFKSTDLGDTWQPLNLGIGATDDVFDLQIDPHDSNVLWAVTESGLMRSTNAGVSWSKADRGTGRYVVRGIALHPTQPGTVYTAAADIGIMRSNDHGASWSPIGTGFAAGWIEKLYAGGGVVFAQTSVGLFRGDGEGNWTAITEPLDDSEAEPDGILFDRQSPKTVYAFDTSKLFRSTNGGASWSEVEQKELSMRQMMKGITDQAQFRSFVQDSKDPKVFYAGSWSNSSPGSAVFKTTDGGKNWAPSGNGLSDDDVVLLRTEAPGIVFAIADDVVYRTTDAGAGWSKVGDGLPDDDLYDLLVDPADTDRVFVASETGLFRSTDNGGSFSRVGSGIEGDDVKAIAVGNGAVYAGTFNGIFRSTDGGENWTSLSEGLPNPNVRAIALDGDRLYVGVGGGSVWVTAVE